MSLKSDCPHCIERIECIHCSPKYKNHQMVIMACKKCTKTGGQTWHKIDGIMAKCARCGTLRKSVIAKKDIGITR